MQVIIHLSLFPAEGSQKISIVLVLDSDPIVSLPFVLCFESRLWFPLARHVLLANTFFSPQPHQFVLGCTTLTTLLEWAVLHCCHKESIKSQVTLRFMFTMDFALVPFWGEILSLNASGATGSWYNPRHLVWSLVSLADWESKTEISEAEQILSLNGRLD